MIILKEIEKGNDAVEKDIESRLAELEREVHALRFELNELKKLHSTNPIANQQNDRQAILTNPSPEKSQKVQFKPLNTQKKKTEEPSQKKQRTFEETIMWALPKVFMIILILGVLWGLKLIGDYGFLSNPIKIILAYLLSISLIGIAYRIERRRKDAHIITIALYGGAFIIGILTTAAGAILYEVLPLYVALLFTGIYIAYGVFISYLKNNEILTIFVTFTSLLLPYLLEFMDFSGSIILAFVLIVFGSLQPIVLKHHQRIAIYIAYFFSILSIRIIWTINHNTDLLYAFGLIFILMLFIASWLRLYTSANHLKPLHEGFLFGLSLLSILFLNSISGHYSEWLLAGLALLFLGVSLYSYKHTLSPVVDVLGTLSLLALFNVLVEVNLTEHVEDIIYPLSSFAGLLLALRLRASLMKITYSAIFTFNVVAFNSFSNVKPFWSIGHFNHILILLYMIILHLYSKRPKEGLNRFESLMKKLYVSDFVPVIITAYFFLYVFKLDWGYFTGPFEVPYVLLIVLAIVTIASLNFTENTVGRFLPYVLLVTFFFAAVQLMFVHYGTNSIWLNISARIVYAFLLIAIVLDAYQEGFLYSKWFVKFKLSVDSFLCIGVIFVMFLLMGILSQLEVDGMAATSFVITSHTVLLFITATLSLWLSTLRKLKYMRYMGFGILPIAIMKLIFFDLSSLDLVIRAILFIAIGGIGLLLSNQLLKKN